MKKLILLTCLMAFFLCRISPISAQVAISTDGSGPDNSAMLDVKSASKGFLPPRLALISSNIASPVTAPATGLLVFNTATAGISPDNVSPGYYFWNGQHWLPVALPQGVNPGDMIYWTGSGWNIIPAGLPGQFLQLSQSYIPTWVGNTFAVITTADAGSITEVEAIVGGEITDDGGSAVTSRGICFSTSPMPDVADTAISCGNGTGSFNYSLTGLTGGITYFVRAFAVTSVGTAYGNEVTFTTTTPPPSCPGIPTLVYEGKTYHTVVIGTQCWLKENLNAGTMISGSSDQSDNSILEKYCYNNLESNCDLYGGLYQWAEAVQYYNGASNVTSWSPVPSREITGICPAGWHLPSDGDWNSMIATLGGIEAAGGKMKESGLLHWVSPNTGASNSSGFTALPGGYRFTSGTFHSSGYSARSWASNEFSGSASWFEQLVYNDDNIVANNISKLYGHSVRCLKDTCTSYSTVSVSISASANPVSAGTQVTFTATAVNGGAIPGYQWNVNGSNVGSGNATYTYTPSNNDVIFCIVTSQLTCISGNPATSTAITMQVAAAGEPCPGVVQISYGGQTYNTVQIGEQCWLRENLNIGTRIDNFLDQSNNGIAEKYCYDDLESNCAVYGGFYQWAELVQYLNGASNLTSWDPVPVGNVEGLCPNGWHIPSDSEWTQIASYLDGAEVAGGKMKETGEAHWLSPNTDATNSSGFTALGCGHRAPEGGFIVFNQYTNYWSSTEYSTIAAWSRALGYIAGALWTDADYYKTKGFSVRCVKNNP